MKKDWVVIGILALSATVTVSVSYSARETDRAISVASIPKTIEDWEGIDIEIDERTYDLLETRNVMMRQYTRKGEAPVVLCIVMSEQNRTALHPPEVCYEGDGYEILDKKAAITSANPGVMPTANRMVLSKEGRRQLVFYWYKTGAAYTHSFYKQQWDGFIGQLLKSGNPSMLIRISTPLYPDETESDQRIERFAKILLPAL